MTIGEGVIGVQSREYWFKTVDFLQQNWALVDEAIEGVVVWFFGDTAEAFDPQAFAMLAEAAPALWRNRFRRHADDPNMGIDSEATAAKSPNGLVYLSGRKRM